MIIIRSFHTFLPVFFFNDTATTEIYTLSLHDALPILGHHQPREADDQEQTNPSGQPVERARRHECPSLSRSSQDRKSTRLNSSHQIISYAVFCLKKKKKKVRP